MPHEDHADLTQARQLTGRAEQPGDHWLLFASRQERICCRWHGRLNWPGWLGRSPFEVFAHVEREPYAAASIAQIHRAKLASGTPVFLKIRRPGIEGKTD